MRLSKRSGMTVIGGLLIASLLLVGLRSQTAIASPKTQIETPSSLRIWWPDIFYTEGHREDIDDIFAAYNSTEVDIQIYPYLQGDDVRRLSLTKQVASDALPHLTLIRQDELSEAIRIGLVRPLDRWQLEGTLPNLAIMGQVNGIQYGVPYMFQMQHMIYTPAFDTLALNSPPTTSEILETEEGMIFPAIPTNNQVVSNFVLSQYLVLGGQLVNDDGQPALTSTILLTLLRFYADELENGVFDAEVANYMSIDDYRQHITDDEKSFAFVRSQYYIEQRQVGRPTMSITPIPNANGDNFVIFDGWVWVLLTDDPIYQDQALEFVQWMTEAERSAEIARASGLLPNRESSLLVLRVSPYLDFINNLSADQIFVMPARPSNNAALSVLQQVFMSVISSESTPEEALTTALETLGQSQ